MELSVVRQTIEAEELICDARAQELVRAEALAPGAGRDEVEILLEDAILSLGAAEAREGRVALDGVVRCQAVYRLGGETAARALTAQASFSQSLDAPGAEPSMTVRARGAVEHVEANYENGHIVLRVTIALRAQVLRLRPIDVITQIAGAEGLEARFQQLCSVKLAAETGAEAVVRDEVQLPAALDARVALMDWSRARVTSVAPDLGGVRVQGEAQVESLIGTGVPGRPAALVKVALPFEALAELPDWLTGDVKAEAAITRLSTQVEQDEDGDEKETLLKLEADVSIRVLAFTKDCALALTDAYATGDTDVEIELGEASLCAGYERFDAAENCKGTLLLPDGAPGVGTVLAVRARPALAQISARDGVTTLEGILETGVVYLPGGGEQPRCARGETPFSLRVNGELDEDAWIDVDAYGAEASALMSDRLEIKCVVSATGFARRSAVRRYAAAATGSEAAKREGGMTVVWPGREDSAWSVGRKYRVPLADVGAANGGREELEAGKPILLWT